MSVAPAEVTMFVKRSTRRRVSERMSDRAFQVMTVLFDVQDFLFPYIDRRVKCFGLCEGMTVVDYGCGPGRYTTRFAQIVGLTGRVYAVDIQPLAIAAVQKKMAKLGLANVVPLLAHGYDSGVPDHVADVVCAIDMFFSVRDPTAFLGELKRMAKPDGVLVIDDGHQPRAVTKRSILDLGHWAITEQTRDHLKCKPS
jgi:ubiquinone/menaquinone biosynthesis C-methylase UbiE